MRHAVLLPLVFTALLPAVARAQDDGDPAPPPGRPAASALKLERAPVVDGDVLNDEVWQAIAPTPGDFVQKNPAEGTPATERTEVRLLYTATALYVGIVCFDRDPAGIVVSDARRDSSLDNTDSVRFILDTYRDGQSGFVVREPLTDDVGSLLTTESVGAPQARSRAGAPTTRSLHRGVGGSGAGRRSSLRATEPGFGPEPRPDNDGRRHQDTAVQRRQDVFVLDQDQIPKRTRIGDDDHSTCRLWFRSDSSSSRRFCQRRALAAASTSKSARVLERDAVMRERAHAAAASRSGFACYRVTSARIGCHG